MTNTYQKLVDRLLLLLLSFQFFKHIMIRAPLYQYSQSHKTKDSRVKKSLHCNFIGNFIFCINYLPVKEELIFVISVLIFVLDKYLI